MKINVQILVLYVKLEHLSENGKKGKWGEVRLGKDSLR